MYGCISFLTLQKRSRGEALTESEWEDEINVKGKKERVF
jgi:hypothetical protein